MFAKNNIRVQSMMIATLLLGFVLVPEVQAQRGRGGGGGARPSMGQMGGGGARPSMPSMSRPTMPNVSRPNMPSRPSTPNISRPNPTSPSFGNVNSRPFLPNMGGAGGTPSIGGSRPSLGGLGNMPNAQRPSTRPSVPPNVNRPVNPPSATRPSLTVASNRPQVKPPNVQIPTTRPSTGIGQSRPMLPGGGDRPSLGNANRPTTLPGLANRPNRPNIGNDTNINIGNTVNIGNRYPNRPNWDVDPGFSRPSWGLGGGSNWNENWHDNCINHHHHWYNGCWHGYWGSSWYAPVVWGGIGWGLGSWTNSWGSSYTSYYNPYYAQPIIAQSTPFDYSQPVVVNNYVDSTSESSKEETRVAQPSDSQEMSFSSFDQGLAKFRSGQYISALTDFNTSIKELPGDPVVHEVRSLALFAIGDYTKAAAGLNSLLSSAPGMDWTTMSGLYGEPEDYTTQLRKLEKFCKQNPNDAGAYFVLAYHCLVTGQKDAAVNALKVVVKNQPKDVTAMRMLEAMAPSEKSTTPSPATPPTASASPASAVPVGTAEPQTDLVGSWKAQTNDTNIELSITEESQFKWKASVKDQPAIQLDGMLAVGSDGISLETKNQGSIGGSVVSKGADNWVFIMTGAPASDPGLSFTRIK
ncbi:MAG: hypothetical protein LW870_13780 [Pirellula sp.]|jgi:tetratricopeptide (TPR) repeat protein|nr:hypothetical protein [Pirellula sp.]